MGENTGLLGTLRWFLQDISLRTWHLLAASPICLAFQAPLFQGIVFSLFLSPNVIARGSWPLSRPGRSSWSPSQAKPPSQVMVEMASAVWFHPFPRFTSRLLVDWIRSCGILAQTCKKQPPILSSGFLSPVSRPSFGILLV